MLSFDIGEYENKIIARIYEAALNPSHWVSVLQSISDLCNTHQATLFFHDRQCRSRNFAAAAKMNGNIINSYLEHFIDIQASETYGKLGNLRAGELVTREDVKEKTGFEYEEALGQHYMKSVWPNLHFHAGAILLRTNNVCAGIGVQRFNGSPNLSHRHIINLQKLIPHLVQAFQIHNRLNSALEMNQSLCEAINSINLGIILLDNNLQADFINLEASRIIHASRGLTLDSRGFIRAEINNEDKQLRYLCENIALHGLSTKNMLSANTKITLHSKKNAGDLQLTILPIKSTSNDKSNFNSVRTAIFINDPARPWAIPKFYLQQTYGLTTTESSIIYNLLSGDSLSDIAAKRSTSIETVRSQIKKIMQKTNTHSQAELTRLILFLCDNILIKPENRNAHTPELITSV